MTLSEIRNERLTPELLIEFGFTTKGFKKDVFGKDHLRLLKLQSGYFIVDSWLNTLNKKPIVFVFELSIIHEFFLGTSL